MRKTKLLTGVSMLALAMTIAVGISVSPAKTVKAAGDVEINETNFPNNDFRDKIKESFDSDSNGKLSEKEIKNAKELSLRIDEVDDLTGIGYLFELEKLDIQEGKLQSLDLTGNKKLVSVRVVNNSPLDKIDLSGCSELKTLELANTSLTEIDLSCNQKLKTLSLSKNPFETLDLSKNILLETLDCSRCHDIYDDDKFFTLKKLDLSNCTLLKELNCSFNNLTELDVSDCKALKKLICCMNNLTELDISKCPILVETYTNGKKGSYFYDTKYDDPDTYTLSDTDNNQKKATINGYLELDSSAKVISIGDVSLDKHEANVVCGKTLSLNVSLKNKAKKASWSSSDKEIATVDKDGKVNAKKAGMVTITATDGDSSDECIITVLYKDVKNSKDFWFKPTNYLTAAGVVKGYDKQTKFKPMNECTRAQMVTFLYRLQGEPETDSDTCNFIDVKKTDYFFKPVIWAVENGITTGVSWKKNEFDPQLVCTRAQTVTFLWRMAGKPEPKAKTCKYYDVYEHFFFYKPVIWASEMKILEGYKDGSFRPGQHCSRRQMVTFLYKYDKYVNGKG